MIEIQDCVKRFGSHTAVNGLSFAVGRSEILGLLGPNGAGKSTTIKMMVGLLRPDSGVIKIGGYDIARDPVEAKTAMAYVPEKSFIFEKLTAWEYLLFISGLYRMNDGLFREKAGEYLDLFGLTDWKDEVVENFSLGMKQRLVLTSCFMRDPKVLILDEPHNGLDPRGIQILKEVLFRQKEKGMTILLSTHIISLAEQICDNIIIINKGTVAAQGTSEDLKKYAESRDRTLEDIFFRLTSDYGQ